MLLEEYERSRVAEAADTTAAEANVNRLERQATPADRITGSDASQAWKQQVDGEIQRAGKVLSQLEPIHPESWEKLNLAERLETMRGVESRMAAIQGRPAVEVVARPMADNLYGRFDPDQGRIEINQTHLAGGKPVHECVDTIVHEGRHAFQDYAVKHPGVAPAEITSAWSENFNHIYSFEEYGDLYMTQPLEADAWHYAGRVTAIVYGEGS